MEWKRISLLVGFLLALGLFLQLEWYIVLTPIWIILLIGISLFIVKFINQYKINYEVTRKEKEEKS